MNTWPCVQAGELQSFAGGPFALYRVKFLPFISIQKTGGQIVFQSISGKAEVWLDHKFLGTKESFEASPLRVQIPPGEGPRVLTLLIQTTPGVAAGLGGTVHVTGDF